MNRRDDIRPIDNVETDQSKDLDSLGTLSASTEDAPLLSLTVSQLVERWPETMRVLTPLGIDLCCGGGRQLGEALTLHHADTDAVVKELRTLIPAAAVR